MNTGLIKESAQVSHSIFWSFVQHWGARLITFLVFFVLARLLEPADFGVIALAGVLLALAEVLIEAGFADALVQRQDLHALHIDTAFMSQLGLAGLYSLLLFVFAPFIAVYLGEPKLTKILWAFIPYLILLALGSVQQALLKRALAYKSLAFRASIANILGGLVGVGCAFSGLGVWSLVIQQLVFAGVGVVVLWRSSVWRPRWQWQWQSCRELLQFGGVMTFSKLLDFVYNRLNDLLIGRALGALALGFYNVGAKLAQIMVQLLIVSIMDVSLSIFAQLQQDRAALYQVYIQVLRQTTFLALPIFVLVAGFSDGMVVVLFGQKWAASAPILQALAYLGAIQSIAFYHGALLNAVGLPTKQLGLNVLQVLLTVAAFMLCAPHGVGWVANGVLAVGLLLLPIGAWTVQHALGFRVFAVWWQIRIPILGCVGLILYTLALQPLLLSFSALAVLPVLGAGLFAYLAWVAYMDAALILPLKNKVWAVCRKIKK